MIAALAKSIFGSSNDRYVRSLGKYVDAVNAFEPTISAMTDDELRQQTEVFRRRLEEGIVEHGQDLLAIASHPRELLDQAGEHDLRVAGHLLRVQQHGVVRFHRAIARMLVVMMMVVVMIAHP